ncbi:hypothetical protein ACFY1U_22155 [Streptomyces sp. NPDC001351]|uniref:hypothetical protein n=1 Tax=Streptomyces sp. NPDC001351 TaxID=3364564 RepID=UPI0036C36698
MDEKSKMQAIDRPAPILPALPTTTARMSHDYARHGTTSLFAAPELSSGSLMANTTTGGSWSPAKLSTGPSHRAWT